MFRNFRRLGLLIAPALVFFNIASAANITRLSFEQLTDSSEIVVSGQVTRTWADWDSSHKYIWTHYELTVSAAHKGAPPRILDIAEPGGRLDGVGMNISGATGYQIGESVMVFLSRMPNGYLRTAGLGQGKYVVDASGRLHGDTLSNGVEMMKVNSGAATGATGSVSLNGMNMSEASQRIAARARVQTGVSR